MRWFMMGLSALILGGVVSCKKDKEEEIVPVTELKPEFAPVDTKQSAYVIQVSSFRSESKAQDVLQKLTAAGYSAHIVTKDLPEKGVWHRVCVGHFASKGEAEALLTKIKADYKDSFIISRK